LTPYTVTTTDTPDTNQPGGRPGDYVPGSYTSAGDFSFTTFTLTTPTDFANETATLESGRYATQEEIDSGALVAIINIEMATLNNLSIGDSLVMTPTADGFTSTPITFTVIGIYSTTATVDTRMASMIGSSLLPQNKIYTPFSSLKTIGYTDEQLKVTVLSSAVITLTNPDNQDAFLAEANSKVTLTYGQLVTSDALYEQLSGSITSMGNLSSGLVWIVVLAGAAILALITALTVNTRKNEIGILLAIGESKFRIIAQFVVEVVAIAVIAFTLASFSGVYVGKYLSTSTLASFATTQNQQPSQPGQQGQQGQPGQQGGQFDRNGTTAVVLDVTLSPIVIVEFFGAGLLISVLAVAIPALYVTRFNPKQILTNNG